MKTIEVDDQLYQYIAGNTKFIGESASDILRRLLGVDNDTDVDNKVEEQQHDTAPQKSITKINNQDSASSKEPNVATEVVAEHVDSSKLPVKKDVESKTSCQSIFDVINKEELAMQRGAVGRFLLILANLYRVHTREFETILEIRGRNRLYFAKSENELLESGSSTKPKRIPDTQFWVITNSNTTKKKLMLTDVAKILGYSAQETELIRDFL